MASNDGAGMVGGAACKPKSDGQYQKLDGEESI